MKASFEDLPEDWNVCPLRSLLREVDVRVADLPLEQRRGIEVLSLTKRFGLIPQSVRFDKRVATENVDKYKVVRRGWIAYNPYVIWEGAIHALRRDIPGIVSPVYAVWERTEKDGGFLDHLLRTPEMIAEYERFSAGAVNRRRTIKKEGFGSIEVAIPPLPEQRKIAAVLGLVQRAMDQQERLLALTAELKKALLNQLFTHGVRHEPQRQTDLGPIPQSWDVCNLSGVVAVKNGQVDPRQSPYREMPHVGPENIEAETGRLLPLQTNGDLGIKSGNYLFTPDDVLYSKIRPYLKKAAQPDFEGTCSADMYPLRAIDRRLSKRFLFHLLLSEAFSKQAISFQDRTGIPKINRQQLGRIQIAIPSPLEQDKIASSLDAIDEKLSLHRRKHSALSALFRTLLHELMTACIRVDRLDLPGVDRL